MLKTMHRRAWLAFALLAMALTAWLLLDPIQRLLIFRPAFAESDGFRRLIARYEEVWIPVANGEKIHAWWAPAEDVPSPDKAPALLYLHGSRWNLTGSASRIAAFQAMGFNVLAIDYRGFGRSSLRLPSESSARDDALAAWHWLRSRVPEPRKRILYGHSIGGAIATEVALQAKDAAALVIEGTFTSVADMARRYALFDLLPLDWLITQPLDTLSKIGAIAVPLFVVHGRDDAIVPAEMASRIYEAAPQPKRLLVADRFGHLRPVRGVANELRRELLAIACPEMANKRHC